MDPPIVLILGGGLAFMLALSAELSRRDIAALPARTVREARTMIAWLSLNLDLLVIDCSCLGGCAFAIGIHKDLRAVQIVGIVSDLHQCKRCSGHLAAQLRNPEDQVPERISYCAGVVQELLRERRRRNPRNAGGK